MARKSEASGNGRRGQRWRRARTTERELTTSALIILVAIFGDGQEALLFPGRCGCFALLLDQWCSSPAGRGGDIAAGAHPSTKVPIAGIDRSRECASVSAKRGKRDCNRVLAGKSRRGIRHSPFDGRRIGYRRAHFDTLSCGCCDKQDAALDSQQLPRASRGLPAYRLPPRSQSAAPYMVGR